MSPTLYHVPKTISSPIYQALLELNVVDNPVKVVTLTFKDLKTPEHLERNPMGSSPTFVDKENDIAIWESGAVLTYLLELFDTDYRLHIAPASSISSLAAMSCSKNDTADSTNAAAAAVAVSPPSSKDRAKFLHIQQYIVATVYPFVASLYLHTLKPKDEQDLQYVKTATEKWKTLLAPTLVKFLGDGPYFMGNQMTAVDLLAAKPFKNADSLELLQEFPTLHALFQKIQCLPSFSIAYNETAPMDESSCLECRSMVLLPATNDSQQEEKKES